MELNNYNYDKIKIGDTFEIKRTLTQQDVDNFAE